MIEVKNALFLVLLLLLAVSWSSLSAHCHDTNPTPLPENNNPILNGDSPGVIKPLATVPNGKLFYATVPNSGQPSGFHILHVYGTPYEMGYAQAQAYTKAGVNLTEYLDSVWKYFESQITTSNYLKDLPKWLSDMIADFGLELALGATEMVTRRYTGDYIYEEIKGIAEGLKLSETQSRHLLYTHMIAGLTQGKCSAFGAWGDALDPTSGTKLLQLRALDWDMKGPFRNFPAITVYHPPADGSYGHAFVNIGIGGFIGGLTGVSETQLGISEIGVAYPDDSFGYESRIGIPFIFLLRDILQFDDTLEESIERMQQATRTCGDGKSSQFRGFAYSADKLIVMDDKNQLPVASWHPRIPNVAYWGMDWICPGDNLILGQAITKHYGNLTAEVSIRSLTATEGSGSNHLAYYDLTKMIIYVAFGSPFGVQPENGYQRQFTQLDARALMQMTQ